jgi:hypothetical protein
MAMPHNGLVKLSEECAETIQVAQKLIAYPELQSPDNLELYPDQTDLRIRLEQELGDTLATIHFAIAKLSLSSVRIEQRQAIKGMLFLKWDNE